MFIFQAIKNILKHIFPPPTKSFMREMNDLRNHLLAIRGELLSIREENKGLTKELSFIREENKGLEEELSCIREENKGLEEELSSIREENKGLEEELSSIREENKGLTKELSCIREENKDFEKKLSCIHENNKELSKELSVAQKENKAAFERIIHIGDDIYEVIPGKPVFWHNEFERSIIKANWGNVTEETDFDEKYLRLISGLDPESIRILTRIISRQKKYLTTDSETIDLFTREEQEQMRLLKENFNQEIFKVSDKVYAYRNYLLPANHFESSVFYFRHGLDEVKTLDRVKGKAVLDVGGFIGDSVLVFEELKPLIIYSFEADPDNFALMQETLRLNKIENAVPVLTALGDHNGTCVLHKGGSSSGTEYREGIQYTEDIEVPLTTLDDYVAEHPMEIGLIKVDIEGSEPFFLEGAKRTIRTQRPILLLSIYHNAHDFFELKPLIESWNLGYSFHIHKPTFGSATGETLLIAEILER